MAMKPNQYARPEPAMRTVKKHSLSVRIWHWTNAAALLVLMMSGLSIFNAHPRLYWGEYGSYSDAAWLEISAEGDQGILTVGGSRSDTTGLLGIAAGPGGADVKRAFPHWATIPSYYSLSAARRWHFAFGWIFAVGLLLYMLRSLANRHIQRDLHIRRSEWSLCNIWSNVKAHAQLHFPKGEAALSYNILQKLSYIIVIFIFLPAMILTGITMSPAMNAGWPWLLDMFGGRQSARSIHFIVSFALVAFVAVHIVMVIASGPIMGLRAIITGRQRVVPTEGREVSEDA